MNTYRCAPGAVISTSIDPAGTEFVVEFDKDGIFTTDSFHLISLLDDMAADPNSSVTKGSAPKKAAPAPEPEATEEDDK